MDRGAGDAPQSGPPRGDPWSGHVGRAASLVPEVVDGRGVDFAVDTPLVPSSSGVPWRQLAGADPRALLYVAEGQVLTSAGMAAGLDLCLYLVGLDYGPDAAAQRARAMVAPLHRAGGQAQYVPAAGPTDDPTLAAVTTWARDHLAEPITVADLATRALQSPRTFARTFTARMGISPHAWLTAHRVQLAAQLLENPKVPVDLVAARSGLGTSANLRLHLHRAHGTTPTAYRAAFAGAPIDQ